MFWVGMSVGCGPRQTGGPDLEHTELAVADFVKPCDSWQLLAGCLPEDEEPLSPEVLQALNSLLEQELHAKEVTSYIGPSVVEQCREIVLFEVEDLGMSGLEYWSRIGRCVPADLLLIPQVFEWRERKGGEWGAEEPAKVVLDLYLLDVQNKELLDRFHYDQEQKSLTEDLLGFGRFIRRGGKWVSAETLAQEGIKQGLEELGL
ncbi:MAG: hypothetical protein ACLFRE_04960 [Desulfovermiculus sp.]